MMFNKTIRAQVMKVISDKLDQADKDYKCVCSNLDAEHENNVKIMYLAKEDKKVKAFDHAVDAILGKIL